MRQILLFILAATACVVARTPIDTLAWERSDSGTKYVKVHGAYPREQTIYARFQPDSLPEDTAVELLDSIKGWGSVYLPAFLVPSKYRLDFSAFSEVNSNWVYTLKLDTTTLFTGTYTSSKVQVRELAVYADTTKKKLYITRTTRNEAASVTTVDSVDFTTFGQPHRVHWTLNVSNPARLLGLRGYIQQ